MKVCYQTRYEDGVFVGTALAELDPREPSRLVLPGACVETAPPPYPGGCQARWSNGVWVIENAPPQAGVRDGVPYGVQVKWDGADFEGVLVAAPQVGKNQRAEWDGKAWRLIDLPAPDVPPQQPGLMPVEKLAAAGLTIDDLRALGVKVS